MDTLYKLVAWLGRIVTSIGRGSSGQHDEQQGHESRWHMAYFIPDGMCECGARGVVGEDTVWLCATCARVCVVCLAGGWEREVTEAQWGKRDGLCAEHTGRAVESLPSRRHLE